MPRIAGDRSRSAVYTQTWVVRLMLDLAGYTTDARIEVSTIVDAGCGDGAFLAEIVERLARAARRANVPLDLLTDCVRAFDIDGRAIALARERVESVLLGHGATIETAHRLSSAWVIEDDFLLLDRPPRAKWVVGNPPYARMEDIDTQTYSAYRARWPTMKGRADLYIGFYEAALDLLEADGRLCFICADRWMHNAYGGALRRKVLSETSVDLIAEVHQSDVFDSKVAAYPAITVFGKQRANRTAMVTASPSFGEAASQDLVTWFRDPKAVPIKSEAFSAARLESPLKPSESWPSGPPERLAMIADLESRFPRLGETGVEFGVGIATGADAVYIVDSIVDVEPDRLRKVVGPSDLKDGRVSWQSRYFVDPWGTDGLVHLDEYPLMRSYFESHQSILKGRSIAQGREQWWRTIDKPRRGDYAREKLVVADIETRIEPVRDTEGYWPLHSCYFILSATWDLEVLGGYLISEIASAFIEAYSVKMANGHFRVSAQYLKRIRAPEYESIPTVYRARLRKAFRDRDREDSTSTVRDLLATLRP
ncbi:MAG: Eco57I restriction-modification methylase domain-containing protein [Pseudolysinimonas sp.]|uniref:Eco57I restriction-modification methylase domain-containing protein n=1 Tax=Pseudolysinimonas sp. TaxID=2680009 RepID=UPI003C789B5F